MRSIACLLGCFTALYLADMFARLRGPPPLAPAVEYDAVNAVPVERAGEGLACVPGCEASAERLRAFDRTCRGRDGPRRCGRMRAARRLLVGGSLDLPEVYDHSVDGARDLEALPGVGPRLARAIFAARPMDLRSLAAVRGLGMKRAVALESAVGLDDRRLRDICSMGLWPTTSSGCGRPR